MNMEKFVGREKELEVLKMLYASQKSEFIAVYGRRRVGKTFLVRTAFKNQFTFQVTALANVKLSQQLTNFHIALQNVYPTVANTPADNWFIAFQQLTNYIESLRTSQSIVFR